MTHQIVSNLLFTEWFKPKTPVVTKFDHNGTSPSSTEDPESAEANYGKQRAEVQQHWRCTFVFVLLNTPLYLCTAGSTSDKRHVETHPFPGHGQGCRYWQINRPQFISLATPITLRLHQGVYGRQVRKSEPLDQIRIMCDLQ